MCVYVCTYTYICIYAYICICMVVQGFLVWAAEPHVEGSYVKDQKNSHETGKNTDFAASPQRTLRTMKRQYLDPKSM